VPGPDCPYIARGDLLERASRLTANFAAGLTGMAAARLLWGQRFGSEHRPLGGQGACECTPLNVAGDWALFRGWLTLLAKRVVLQGSARTACDPLVRKGRALRAWPCTVPCLVAFVVPDVARFRMLPGEARPRMLPWFDLSPTAPAVPAWLLLRESWGLSLRKSWGLLPRVRFWNMESTDGESVLGF
jgi:hypothetical protein